MKLKSSAMSHVAFNDFYNSEIFGCSDGKLDF
jgi:hypothetical protein